MEQTWADAGHRCARRPCGRAAPTRRLVAALGRTTLVRRGRRGGHRQDPTGRRAGGRHAQVPAAAVVRGRADELDAGPFGLWSDRCWPGWTCLGPEPTPRSPANEQRWEVVDQLDSADGAAPGVLLLDDLHWADDESLWVLEQLVDDLRPAHSTIIATTRPGPEARSPRWPRCTDGPRCSPSTGSTRRGGRAGPATSARDVDPHLLGSGPAATRCWCASSCVAAPARCRPGPAPCSSAALGRAGDEVAAVLSVLAVAGAGTPVEVVAHAAGVAVADVDRSLGQARERGPGARRRRRRAALPPRPPGRGGRHPARVRRGGRCPPRGGRGVVAGCRRATRRRGREGPSPGAGAARGRCRGRRVGRAVGGDGVAGDG